MWELLDGQRLHQRREESCISLHAILVTIFVATCRVYLQKKLVECDGLIRMLCNQSTYPIICIMTDCDQGLHSMKKAPIYMFISDIVLCLLYYFCTLFVELVLCSTISTGVGRVLLIFQMLCLILSLLIGDHFSTGLSCTDPEL